MVVYSLRFTMGNADTKLAFRKAVVHLTTKTQVFCYYTLIPIMPFACCWHCDDRYRYFGCRMLLATDHAHAKYPIYIMKIME